MTAAEDHARAVLDCHTCIATASLEHDAEHARRASAELHRLIPRPRGSCDALVTEQAEDQ